MTTQLQQTYQEAERVFVEWVTNYAPKDLIRSDFNSRLLADYVSLHFGGLTSITNLNAAAANIPNLQRLPKKSAAEIAEGIIKEQRAKEREDAKRGEAKMHKDYINSLESHKPSSARPVAKKILDDQEDIAKVNKEINSYINRYTCNNRIGIDYATTDTRRGELRKIAAGFGNTIKEREAALKAVKQAYFSYPS
jgi:hypothetical protein